MTTKRFALFLGTTLAVAFFGAHAQADESTFILLPDLVVTDVSSPNLDSGVIKVRVRNQGNGSAGENHMAIRVTPLGGSMRVYSPKVPALGPGQIANVQANTQYGLSQANFEAIVDRSDVVHESNESNNRRAGKFDGKP